MDFLTRLWHKITGSTTSSNSVQNSNNGKDNCVSIMPKAKTKNNPAEIQYITELSDEQIRLQQERTKHLTVTNNSDYKVKNGDSLDKIARKHNVSLLALMALNGLNKNSVLKIGQKIKIPPSRKAKNVRSLQDIAKAMGVSPDFIKSLKRAEDGSDFGDNKFHNTPYTDKAGNKTIGIGHLYRAGDKAKLTDAEVCTLCANDLLRVEEDLSGYLGEGVYKKLPTPIKEALIDMVFNKGIEIFEKSEGLAYCLRTGKYEAAINKMTYNRSMSTNKEMAGLSKRRLLDISIAIRVYKNNNIPQSNKSTAQSVYNRGIALLRAECREQNLDFKTQVAAFNKDVKSYFNNKIQLNYITE